MGIDAFLTQRFSSLSCADFASLYDSYHHEAPFLLNFDSVGDYVVFAEQQLSHIGLKSWTCRQRRALDDDRVECLLVMELEVEGRRQFFYELALLIATDQGWRYHSAQKLSTDDYNGSPQGITFDHFDKVADKIRF